MKNYKIFLKDTGEKKNQRLKVPEILHKIVVSEAKYLDMSIPNMYLYLVAYALEKRSEELLERRSSGGRG